MALHAQTDELIQQMMGIVKHFHSKEMLSPHAGTINAQGVFSGTALTSDGSTQLTVAQSLAHFETSFKNLALDAKIVASGIFYHGVGVQVEDNRVTLPPANALDECRAVVGLLEHNSGDSFYLVVSYEGTGNNIQYASGKLIEKQPFVFVSNSTTPVKPWWKIW